MGGDGIPRYDDELYVTLTNIVHHFNNDNNLLPGPAISGSEEETGVITTAVLQTVITARSWEVGPHLDCHIRLSHIQEAGRKYCSAFVTLVFIFSLPFRAT